MSTRARTTTTKKKKKSYHHGDLRRALITSAVALISERERAEFTLRELAKQLGVTHAATYHHFKDKDDLLAAVAEDGFHSLRDYVERAVELVPDNPILRLRASASAYIEFAFEHPAHFRVMYARDYDDEERFPAAKRASDENAAFVNSFWESAAQKGYYRTADLEEYNVASWALIHGLAMLYINGLIERPKELTLSEFSSRITRHLFVGIASDEGRALEVASMTLQEVSESQ